MSNCLLVVPKLRPGPAALAEIQPGQENWAGMAGPDFRLESSAGPEFRQ